MSFTIVKPYVKDIAYKSLYSELIPIKSMDKVITAEEYRELKSKVNAYERMWRKRNPKKHAEKSKQLLTAIKKGDKK